jgi:hypothetical protein
MDFVLLGNTSFSGLFAREHALALTLAQRGFNVVYIEGMPSFALRTRELLAQRRYPEFLGRAAAKEPGLRGVRILTPPTVPTYFRSSVTPAVDRWLFHRWFRRLAVERDWSNTVLMVMFPYWWSGFVDRSLCPARLIVYDICDALLVPSRNATALARMREAENALLADADAVTYSAHEMNHSLQGRGHRITARLIPNAVSMSFIESIPARGVERIPKVIGYVGSIDERWVDRDLILKTAQTFPQTTLVVVSPRDRGFAIAVRRHKNIKWLPLCAHDKLAELVASFDVGLIPFRKNEITRVANPLKLYEYCSAGLPIVATETDELGHYHDLVYLGKTDDEFLANVQIALNERDAEKRLARVKFARANTWDARTDVLLKFIRETLEIRKSR